MRKQKTIVLVLTFSFVMMAAVVAQASAEVVQDLIICKSPGRVDESRAAASAPAAGASVGKAVRMLRVYKTQDVGSDGTSMEGCRATYSKSSVEQTVGSSRLRQQCRNIIVGIQKNLEASQWTCRTVQAASVMKSKAVLTSEASSPNSASGTSSSIQ